MADGLKAQERAGVDAPDAPADAPADVDAGGPGRRRLLRVLPWAVVGVVMVSLASVAVVRLASGPDKPTDADSVRDVADMTQLVAEGLDVEGGLDLLCEAPLDLYRLAAEATIVEWQTRSGSPAPQMKASVSEVDDGAVGSFLLRVSSDEPGLEDERRTFQVFVETRGGRSCVVGIGGRQADSPTVRFAGDGYSGVTSPAPRP